MNGPRAKRSCFTISVALGLVIAGLLTGAGHLFIGSLRRQGEITGTLMFGQSGDFCEHKSLRLVFVMIHKV